MVGSAVERLIDNLLQLVPQAAFGLQENLQRDIFKIRKYLKKLTSELQEESGTGAGLHEESGNGTGLQEKSSDDFKRYLSIRHIRDHCYRFENLLEALIVEGGDSPGRDVVNCITIGLRERWSTMAKFNEIKDKIKKIIKCSSWQGDIPFGYDYFRRNADYSCYYEFYEFVGRVEEKKQLLSFLCSNSSGYQVISIIGIQGIGKTRLARQLFDHPIVKDEFPHRVWVRASPAHKFERREVFAAVAQQLASGDFSGEDDESLAAMISSYLENNKVLMVLDNISSVSVWESLKILLPEMNSISLSKILITTRMKEVAESSGATRASRWIHLTGLPNDKSCELLVKNAPDFLGDLGTEVGKLCCGVPLAIIAFLESVQRKLALEDWDNMVPGFSWRDATQERKEMLEVLASTYYDLPYILQQFFLYMGVLQDDLCLEVEKLCLLSSADGMLKPLQRGEERLLDVEESCVTEVAQRSITDLIEGEEPTITRFKYFRLNRLMRDLSLLINKDEKFVKSIDFACGNQVVPESSLSWVGFEFRTFRVAINLDDYKEGSGFPLGEDEMIHMRVVLLSSKGKRFRAGEFPSLVKFKCMRVLDFSGFDFEQTKLPEGIERAVHLRYLSFKDCVLHRLPSWVTNLKLLCILDLRVQQSTAMIIPDVLWKLRKLKHLYFPLSFVTVDGHKLSLHGMRELETITNFNALMLNLDDLLGLPKLQYLDANAIENDEEIQYIVEFMTKNSKTGLLRTSLEIRNFNCYTEERDSLFEKLLACRPLIALNMQGSIRMPAIDDISQNLTKIVLIGSELIEDPMGTFGKLPKLRVLVLDKAFEGKEIVCSWSGFVELKILKLVNLECLEECIIENGAMAKLSTLAISNCGKLTMPEGLRFLLGLEELRVPKRFQERIENGGEDYYKVKHVPSIKCDD